ncbi:unnamed protein product [Musa acuminata subsp. malaccensis]|uniref:(wild Malaysian banana) hypothetical protein n=1 Tax=Musa acuminata subsp. malaccensis TaxID=214687 RepID=A0A8D7FT75_MUSAM|nr:unnamed protein product [Musa acuminata subsp. malaccensis]
MAASFQIRSHFLLLLLVLFVFIVTPQLSSCRPIKAVDPSNDGRVLVPSPESHPGRAPCSNSRKEQLAEKYKPLLLNLLPRGPSPPSGPSPGINSNNKN